MRPVIAASVVAAMAATAVGAAPLSHALGRDDAPAPALTGMKTVAQGASQGMYAVPGLDQKVVDRYKLFITLDAKGHYRANIPAAMAINDPQGARAARDAVRTANHLIDTQRKALADNGASAAEIAGRRAVASGVASQVLPMGEHATFQADWWGMTFTLDAVAAKQVTDALDHTQDVSKLVDALGAIGVVIGPAVAATIKIVLAGIAAINDSIKANVTEDGLVIKALWILIPWTEKPAGPFQPAPPKPGTAPVPTPAPTPAPSPTNVPVPGPVPGPVPAPTGMTATAGAATAGPAAVVVG